MYKIKAKCKGKMLVKTYIHTVLKQCGVRADFKVHGRAIPYLNTVIFTASLTTEL